MGSNHKENEYPLRFCAIVKTFKKYQTVPISFVLPYDIESGKKQLRAENPNFGMFAEFPYFFVSGRNAASIDHFVLIVGTDLGKIVQEAGKERQNFEYIRTTFKASYPFYNVAEIIKPGSLELLQ